MSEMVISSGIGDTALYLQAAANVAAPFNGGNNSGNYPLVGDMLVNRKLASRWLMMNLASRAFVDGMGVTSVGAESENTAMIRFPLMYMPPRIKRTLGLTSAPGGTPGGTPGNNLPFNRNLPHGMQTDGYDMKFDQEYDEAAQISKVNMRLIGNDLDALGRYTENIPTTVGMLQDADILATHVGAGLAYAYSHANTNLINYDSSVTTDGYLQELMNSLTSKLSNVKGMYKEGVISYPKEKSVIVMRWGFFNKLKTIKNGALVNSDEAQKIILNGYLNESGTRLMGNYIEGKYNGIYIKVLSDELFDMAAGELNLTASQYAEFNKIQAYIANAEGFMHGMSATVTEIEKAPTTSIGFIIRNDWGWGVKAVRPSAAAFIVSGISGFTNPVTTFDGITSPGNLEDVISGYQSGIELEKSVQRIGVANGNYICTVSLTVTDSESTPGAITAADVVVRKADGTYITATNAGSGVYKFDIERGTAATALISATGYVSASQEITAANSAGLTYSATKALVAEA